MTKEEIALNKGRKIANRDNITTPFSFVSLDDDTVKNVSKVYREYRYFPIKDELTRYESKF